MWQPLHLDVHDVTRNEGMANECDVKDERIYLSMERQNRCCGS